MPSATTSARDVNGADAAMVRMKPIQKATCPTAALLALDR